MKGAVTVRVLKIDELEGVIKVEPKGLEDLWYLSTLIQPGDVVEGKSFRRHKTAGNEGDRPDSGEKKPVFLAVSASSVEFAESANKLRVTGKIVSGEPEELVQVGSFHTIDIEEGHAITIKKKITAYDLEILDEAKRSAKAVKAAVVAIDERKANFFTITASGIHAVAEIESGASKRDLNAFDGAKKSFFAELYSIISNAQFETLVVAGPGFAKDEFAKYLKAKDPKMASKARLEHASTAERNAASEILKRGALERVFSEQKVQDEFNFLEKLKISIAKDDGLSCYGLAQVQEASGRQAIGTLLVLDKLGRTNQAVAEIMKSARQAKARTVIFNSADEAGAEFSTFGIAALLRYKKYD